MLIVSFKDRHKWFWFKWSFRKAGKFTNKLNTFAEDEFNGFVRRVAFKEILVTKTKRNCSILYWSQLNMSLRTKPGLVSLWGLIPILQWASPSLLYGSSSRHLVQSLPVVIQFLASQIVFGLVTSKYRDPVLFSYKFCSSSPVNNPPLPPHYSPMQPGSAIICNILILNDQWKRKIMIIYL